MNARFSRLASNAFYNDIGPQVTSIKRISNDTEKIPSLLNGGLVNEKKLQYNTKIIQSSTEEQANCLLLIEKENLKNKCFTSKTKNDILFEKPLTLINQILKEENNNDEECSENDDKV